MIKKLLYLTIALVFVTGTSWAQEEEYSGPYDDEPVYENNLGALNNEDAAAVITGESGGANGTAQGEITIYSDTAGVKVYSGLNKVEVIPPNSDGWVGSYTLESSSIRFHPAGRPVLDCPAQDAPGWFGPCKVPENT